MMRKIGRYSRLVAGAVRPLTGVLSPTLVSLAVVLGGSLFALGCGSGDTDINLPPAEVGMAPSVAPIFNDGETELFEVKRGFQFPILAPDPASQAALNKDKVEPYGREPWITADDVKVQLTWTLSNLDNVQHNVEILVDPWNEFGRYYPGMQLADAQEQKFEPNLSGIDEYFVLDAASAGDSSRRHGTFTFDDMHEMAVDFATVQNLIKNPPAALPGGFNSMDMGMDNPLPIYANHAFNVQNRSYDDPLSAPYIPAVIAGLTGIDFGFRTSDTAPCAGATGNTAPADAGDTADAGDAGTTPAPGMMVCADTIALEIAIEIVDTGDDRVQKEGGTKPLLKPTTVVVTVGTPVPTGTMAM
ncbi:MAG TPA: hypothetical protein VK745_21410 [Polyangiaceae bacterium]|jgi:hypothetical protein|nr:hypothetical protein [Polyangiaceae bacterium]